MKLPAIPGRKPKKVLPDDIDELLNPTVVEDTTSVDVAKAGKKEKGEVFGLDCQKVGFKPNVVTIAMVAAGLGVAFFSQNALAAEPRQAIPSVQQQITAKSAERAALDARLAEVSDQSRDERIAFYLDQGRMTDAAAPYTDGTQVEIDPFEIALPQFMRDAGLDPGQSTRGRLAEARDVAGGYTLTVQIPATGPQDAFYRFVDALRNQPRLVTIGDDFRVSSTGDSASDLFRSNFTFYLWFSSEQSIEQSEAEQTGLGLDPLGRPNLQPTDDPTPFSNEAEQDAPDDASTTEDAPDTAPTDAETDG
jgi:hypothetical protein